LGKKLARGLLVLLGAVLGCALVALLDEVFVMFVGLQLHALVLDWVMPLVYIVTKPSVASGGAPPKNSDEPRRSTIFSSPSKRLVSSQETKLFFVAALNTDTCTVDSVLLQK